MGISSYRSQAVSRARVSHSGSFFAALSASTSARVSSGRLGFGTGTQCHVSNTLRVQFVQCSHHTPGAEAPGSAHEALRAEKSAP